MEEAAAVAAAADKVVAATASAVDQAKAEHPATVDVVAGLAGACPVAAAEG